MARSADREWSRAGSCQRQGPATVLKVMRMLSSLGYEVSVFTIGSDAWQEFSSQPEVYDLVITDLTMPGMTGIKLARKMIDLQPEIPIILVTGYSETLNLQHARAAGIREMIVKPLRFNDLATVVRRVLDESCRNHRTVNQSLSVSSQVLAVRMRMADGRSCYVYPPAPTPSKRPPQPAG